MGKRILDALYLVAGFAAVVGILLIMAAVRGVN